jgi:hypothetical protein
MNDRIKLAEAMGWKRSTWFCQDCFFRSDGRLTIVNSSDFFDPFTDANDDYAVLRWIVGDDKPFNMEVIYSLEWNVWEYKVGDYARAALEVIE